MSRREGTCSCGRPLALVARQTWQHQDGETYRHRVEVVERGKPERVDAYKVGGRLVLLMLDGQPHALVAVAADGSASVQFLGVMPTVSQHGHYDDAFRFAVEQAP